MKKQKIIFITGNKGKLKEAQSIILEIKAKDIDLPEIQEIDAKKVIEAKLLEAYKHHKGEYIVEDTSLYLDCLNGLPGPLIKWFLQQLGNNGIYNLVRKYKTSKAQAKTIVGYINKAGKVKYFEGIIKGKIVKPKGKGFGWDPIFQPNGFSKTFGQMTSEEKNRISMRKKALTKLKRFMQK
jgi:non-canonical purine NTP pyrophosphatase (RdgB/HAM1 family)